MRQNGTGTAVGCDIDGIDLPPLIRLGFPTLVILKFIFNQYASGSTSCLQKKVGYTAFRILSLDSATYPPLISVKKTQPRTAGSGGFLGCDSIAAYGTLFKGHTL